LPGAQKVVKILAYGEIAGMDVVKDAKELQLTPMEEEIFRLATPYLQVRDNERHTWNALAFALRLLERYGGDREVVAPATILHDVGWSRLSKTMLYRSWGPMHDKTLEGVHEEAGAEIAAPILYEVDCDRATTDEVIAIVAGHDTRKVPLSLNDKVVKDADKLTRYSGSFWSSVRLLSLTGEEFSGMIGPQIDRWFFLDLSRSMARAELDRRRFENPVVPVSRPRRIGLYGRPSRASSACLTAAARRRLSKGFMRNTRMPNSFAFSGDTVSL
jgi:hypothetical protein